MALLAAQAAALLPTSSPSKGFHTAGKEGRGGSPCQADQQSVDFDALDPFLLKFISKSLQGKQAVATDNEHLPVGGLAHLPGPACP